MKNKSEKIERTQIEKRTGGKREDNEREYRLRTKTKKE